MPKLPRLTADEVIKVIASLGFSEVRQSGSHKIFRNATRKRITVPYHSGKIIHPKVLRSILRDAELTVEQLREYL